MRVESLQLGVLLSEEEVVGAPVWFGVGRVTVPATPSPPEPRSGHGAATWCICSLRRCFCQSRRGRRRLVDMVKHASQGIGANLHGDHVTVLELPIDGSRDCEIVGSCGNQTFNVFIMCSWQ